MNSISSAVNPRFAFGKNWRSFLSKIDEERIREAQKSLREMLGVECLDGRSFLDVGSGSGLFSLAAAELGASRIHSFDFDPDSVWCTQELKRRYRPEMKSWTIESGSILDEHYLEGLGSFDVVYSWGVLHHTGNMWPALERVTALVEQEGKLFIAIYNDQGSISRIWTAAKRIYISGRAGKALITGLFVPYFAAISGVRDLTHLNNPAATYRQYKKRRGMSMVHDWRDWLGGYPFDVASRESIIRFSQDRGFRIVKLKSAGRASGNNEFVFDKSA